MSGSFASFEINWTIMEQEEKPKDKPDRGLIIALIAIVINVVTVSVYIYQARIMQTQQHVSAWPYLEWLFYQDDGLYIQVNNNGIGPALIKSVHLKLDGKEVPSFDSLVNLITGPRQIPVWFSTVQNRVLPAGQSIRALHVKDKDLANKVYQGLQEHSFEFEVCYESIYGDAWTTKGIDVMESKCK
jgi:hypothetical protein